MNPLRRLARRKTFTLVAVATLAALVPATRAARLEPMQVLREG